MKLVGLSSVTHDDIPDISMEDQRRRSAEQPASSLHRAAQLASNVHTAAHAKHTEYTKFLGIILNDFMTSGVLWVDRRKCEPRGPINGTI